MLVVSVIALVLAVTGHVAICVFLNNRLHAQGWPRPIIKSLSAFGHVVMTAGAAAAVWWWAENASDPRAAVAGYYGLIGLYAALCILIAAGPLPLSLWRRRTCRTPAALCGNHSRLVDFRTGGADIIGPGWRRWLVRLPLNEVLRLEINEKRLAVPRLDASLEGLSIAHLSDLHFTGVIGRRYFEEAIELANQMEPDIVAVTGDLLDKSRCLDWVPYTLGRLRARHGAFFVLGNHDLQVDCARLRETLEDAGLVDLSGQWHSLCINGCAVVLAGNELPWFRRAPSMSDCPGQIEGRRPLRILLAHSPDQIDWARKHDFDLLLAGHNHGGQIRLPLVGPVFSPSRYGVRYACGVFHEPPTLMHVSRGLSAKTPLRYECPPELTKLVLTCAPPARI